MCRLNVLLVDDDRNLATTLSYGLRKALGEATSVVVRFSGSEALPTLETQEFDVVVSDFNMPEQSGLEFLNRIKQEYPEMILVLITAYGTEALEEGMRQLGGGYITKPFDPPLLVQLIQSLIQGKETKGRLEDMSRSMDMRGELAGSSKGLHLESSDLTSP